MQPAHPQIARIAQRPPRRPACVAQRHGTTLRIRRCRQWRFAGVRPHLEEHSFQLRLFDHQAYLEGQSPGAGLCLVH